MKCLTELMSGIFPDLRGSDPPIGSVDEMQEQPDTGGTAGDLQQQHTQTLDGASSATATTKGKQMRRQKSSESPSAESIANLRLREEVETLTTMHRQEVETSVMLTHRVEELEAQCMRLQAELASKSGAPPPGKAETRPSQLAEKEAVLEARMKEVEAQILASQEMRAAMEMERLELEEDKMALEEEMHRQQEAADELQEVLAGFFSEDVYSSLFPSSEFEGGSMMPIQQWSGGEDHLSTIYSTDQSQEADNMEPGPSADELMTELHERLHIIATKWKGGGSSALSRRSSHKGSSRAVSLKGHVSEVVTPVGDTEPEFDYFDPHVVESEA